MVHSARQIVREPYGGSLYEYYPIGQHIVAAPGVCGGRPTFKYTRLEVATILDLLATGWTVEQLVYEYTQSHLTTEAVAEALRLAKEALINTTSSVQPPA